MKLKRFFEFKKSDLEPVKSFKIQDELNPKIWDDMKMKKEIREDLLKISEDFFEGTELDAEVKDIILTGSLANYNWSKYSDHDLHIIIDFKDINDDEDLVKDLVDSKKTIWNLQHDIEIGGKKGSKKPVHPNDHVNKSQSTNDVFPTAMHVSIAKETISKLLPNLKLLEKELKKKSNEFKSIVKIGRTHLQDATPLSLGQEFSGYHVQVKKSIERIEYALKEILYLAQGGTAVGTGINSRKNFDKKIVREIAKFTKIPFKPAANKFAELAAHDSIVNFSGTLNTCAVALMKISNDIRFLGSGPRAGYGELILPENEPGSSIMPGKVNPTQCEAVTMVCVKVIGNHNGITIAGSHGHFELNVFKPLIAHNILQSIDLIADSTKNFAQYCVKGIKANKKKIQEHLDNSLMLVTALAPHIGYDNAAKIAKTALKNNTTLKHETLKTGLINKNDYEKIVDPKKMIYPA